MSAPRPAIATTLGIALLLLAATPNVRLIGKRLFEWKSTDLWQNKRHSIGDGRMKTQTNAVH
eukprot:5101997-Lingulodinium_polyedra.AAC.1